MEHFLAMLRMFTLWTPSVREISMAASISSCLEVTFLFMLIPLLYRRHGCDVASIVSLKGKFATEQCSLYAQGHFLSSIFRV